MRGPSGKPRREPPPVNPAARLARALAQLALLAVLAAPAIPAGRAAAASQESSGELARLEARHELLLARHRPDLVESWGLPAHAGEGFVALSESSIDAHARTLRALLDRVSALPASARSDSLRSRIAQELAETTPGGKLRRDALLWLDIVAAAVRAPLSLGSPGGCARTNRLARRLRTVPEALRGAAILLRGAPPPDGRGFEERVSRVEWLLRRDLPARTEACKEPRRLAEFVRADTLAGAALAAFRRRVTAVP